MSSFGGSEAYDPFSPGTVVVPVGQGATPTPQIPNSPQTSNSNFWTNLWNTEQNLLQGKISSAPQEPQSSDDSGTQQLIYDLMFGGLLFLGVYALITGSNASDVGSSVGQALSAIKNVGADAKTVGKDATDVASVAAV